MLGLGPKASQKDITQAYHKLAARYHPDKHQGNELEDLAREKLSALNEAHRVLSDPSLRSSYDSARAGLHRNPYGPGGTPTSPTGRKVSVGGNLKSLAVIVLLFVLAPFLFRIFKSPKTFLVVAIAIAIAWWGPRIIRYFKK